MKLTPINPHFNACDQKWELMPEQDGGRLCESCERVLVDFTPFTEQEVLNQQRDNNFKLCGRYTRGQVDRLHRHLTIEETQNHRPWLVSLAMGLGSMLPVGVAAQDSPTDTIVLDKVEINTPRPKAPVERFIVGRMPIHIENDNTAEQHDSIKVPIAYTVPMPGLPGGTQYPVLDVKDVNSEIVELKGTVKDAETGEPIPFAPVWIEGTNIGIEADFDGNFSLKVHKSHGKVTLITSYIGYEKDSTTIDLSSHKRADLNLIALEIDTHVMGLAIVTVTNYENQPMGQKLKRWSNPANWYRAIRNKIRYK